MRGARLDVNKLVHVPNWGDFQLEMITSAADPNAFNKRKHKGGV